MRPVPPPCADASRLILVVQEIFGVHEHIKDLGAAAQSLRTTLVG